MDLQDLAELHYITPIVNVPSICAHGILSHHRARGVQHDSVALQDVQNKRSQKRVPLADGSSRSLHSYVNLYIHARNPMLYSLQSLHGSLCVLRVSTTVLSIPGTAIADHNAASNFVRFYRSPAGLAQIDGETVLARWWTHTDLEQQRELGRLRCAEVLVPDCVPAEHLLGAYVSCASSQQQLQGLLTGAGMALGVQINADLFFQ